MEQNYIRFVKLHGVLLGLILLILAYRSVPSKFQYEPTVIMEWLLPLLWSVHGFYLLMSVFRGWRMRLLRFTCFGTFGLEFMLMLERDSMDAMDVIILAIILALMNLYPFYVMRTLEQMYADLEKKRREADLINAIVCEGGGDQSKLVHKQNHLTSSLLELYAMGVIQAIRKLFDRRDKKLGEDGSKMPQNDRSIIEVKPINAMEMA